MRFGAFSDDWTKTTLGNVCSYRKERRVAEKTNYISTENILQNFQGVERFDSTEMIAGDAFNANDILMGNIRPYLKKVCFATFDGVCNADVLVFKSDSLNPEFLHCILANDNFISYAMSSVKGSKMPRGDKSHIMQYPISYPNEHEQIKISNFINLLTKRMAVQNKIISKYESLIKGIYAHLQANTHKNKYCLRDIVKYNSVGLLSKEDLIGNGSKKCILYGELFTTYDEVIVEINSKTNADGYISKGNEILFPSSTTVDAMSLIAPSALSEQGIVLGGDMFVLEMKSGFNNEYVSYYLNIIAKRTFAKYAQGTTITHLYFEHIKNLPLYLPNIYIQTNIASTMRKIKKKIEIEKEMLSALQKQKAFLLHSMFI